MWPRPRAACAVPHEVPHEARVKSADAAPGALAAPAGAAARGDPGAAPRCGEPTGGGEPQLPAKAAGRAVMAKLSHLNDKGEARMVDVSAKTITQRSARAEGFVAMA